MKIESIVFTPSADATVRSGLLGFLRCDYGSLRLDGIAVRRTVSGRLALTFPERKDRAGTAHPYVRPIDDVARRAVEAQIFDSLDLRENPS